MRKLITRGKCLTDDWLDVHRVWHNLGGRSSATMMFGHVETLAERIEHLGLTDAALLACCTPEYRAATRVLATFAPGAFCCQREYPEAVWSINQFPSSATSAPPPHLEGGHRHLKITPGPFRMITLIYLSDVEPRGGGTMVWPGSNRKFRILAGQQSGRYSHMDYLRPLVADLARDPPQCPEISSIVNELTGENRPPMGRWTVTNDVTSFLKP